MNYKLLSLLFSLMHLIPVTFGIVLDNPLLFILGCIGVGVFAYINVNL